jgi:hypothetical protein
MVIGKSEKAIRAWTRKGKDTLLLVAFRRSYYPPKNIEDFLANCERPRVGKAVE